MPSDHRSVLLVGSLPYKTVEEVFAITGPALAGYARALPDGEAQGWVNFPAESVRKTDGIEQSDREGQTQPELPSFPLWRVTPGVSPDSLQFAPIGYDRIVLRSYELFKAARATGTIAPNTRFQVSLPTPFSPVGLYMIPEDVPAVLPPFEEAFLREVDRIVQHIPGNDLAIQWDIAVEVISALHGHKPGLKEVAPMPFLAEAIARASNHIPATVALGQHFCYGNPGGHHILEPTDTGLMVTFANSIRQRMRRPLSWIHMPVPISRDDPAYFEPLQDLRMGDETELYLGLVHLRDGLEGSRRRLATAKQFAPRPDFGVGWECGLRLFAQTDVPPMLDLHKQVADLA